MACEKKIGFSPACNVTAGIYVETLPKNLALHYSILLFDFLKPPFTCDSCISTVIFNGDDSNIMLYQKKVLILQT